MKRLSAFGYRIPAKQFIAGMVVWLLIAAVLWSTRRMPFYEEGAPGPRFMPFILCIIFGVLNLFYWLESATRKASEEKDSDRNFVRPAAFLAMTILLIVLWEPAGALVAVFACALLELRYLERYGWGKAVLVSAIISCATLTLFQIILGVALPGGVFEMLSYVRL